MLQREFEDAVRGKDSAHQQWQSVVTKTQQASNLFGIATVSVSVIHAAHYAVLMPENPPQTRLDGLETGAHSLRDKLDAAQQDAHAAATMAQRTREAAVALTKASAKTAADITREVTALQAGKAYSCITFPSVARSRFVCGRHGCHAEACKAARRCPRRRLL